MIVYIVEKYFTKADLKRTIASGEKIAKIFSPEVREKYEETMGEMRRRKPGWHYFCVTKSYRDASYLKRKAKEAEKKGRFRIVKAEIPKLGDVSEISQNYKVIPW